MKVTIVPIVICAFGTVTKGLLKGLEDLEVSGRVETIQMTVLLKTARILRRVLETCCHSISSEKPSADADVKNSKRVYNNNNNNNNNNKSYFCSFVSQILGYFYYSYHYEIKNINNVIITKDNNPTKEYNY